MTAKKSGFEPESEKSITMPSTFSWGSANPVSSSALGKNASAMQNRTLSPCRVWSSLQASARQLMLTQLNKHAHSQSARWLLKTGYGQRGERRGAQIWRELAVHGENSRSQRNDECLKLSSLPLMQGLAVGKWIDR